MNWGSETSSRTQPTLYSGQKRSCARPIPAKHFESPIRAVADRAAARGPAAYPLKIEFRFVLDSGRMITVIRTADETVLEHRDLSLLWQPANGLPGERRYGPSAELFEGVEAGRSQAPPCPVESGRDPHSLPGVSSFAHRTGSSKSSILPIPVRLAAARPFGPGVETGERLFGERVAIRNQRSEPTWQRI